MEIFNTWDAELINIDDPFAKEIGFTSDRFIGYFWLAGDRITFGRLVGKLGQGEMFTLFGAIESKGYTIQGINPSGIMPLILEKKGFRAFHCIYPDGRGNPIIGWLYKRPENEEDFKNSILPSEEEGYEKGLTFEQGYGDGRFGLAVKCRDRLYLKGYNKGLREFIFQSNS